MKLYVKFEDNLLMIGIIMKNIGLSICGFREKKFPGHGGQSLAARAAKASRATWNHYEHAQRLSNATLKKIAKVLDVTVDEIIAKAEDITAAQDVETTESPPGIDAGTPNPMIIPMYGDVAAATNGQDEFYNDGRYDTFVIPAGVGMVRVRGNSMEPIARDGQLVFLRPHEDNPKSGDLVVVWTRHSGTARQLFKRWGGWMQKTVGRDSADDVLVLISINPIDTVNLMEHIRRRDYGGHRIVAGVWYG